MSKPGGGSAVDDLLQLLDKVPDAATLEVLLKAEHLLILLRAQGISDEAIRRDLKQGKRRPGQLLLDVLEREPDTAVLLALLGNPPLPVSPPPAASGGSVVKTKAQGQKQANAGPPGKGPVPRLLVGLLLAAPSGYYLFVRLDVLHVPGLIVYFPGAYTLLFSAFFGGLALVGHSAWRLARGREEADRPSTP